MITSSMCEQRQVAMFFSHTSIHICSLKHILDHWWAIKLISLDRFLTNAYIFLQMMCCPGTHSRNGNILWNWRYGRDHVIRYEQLNEQPALWTIEWLVVSATNLLNDQLMRFCDFRACFHISLHVPIWFAQDHHIAHPHPLVRHTELGVALKYLAPFLASPSTPLAPIVHL